MSVCKIKLNHFLGFRSQMAKNGTLTDSSCLSVYLSVRMSQPLFFRGKYTIFFLILSVYLFFCTGLYLEQVH